MIKEKKLPLTDVQFAYMSGRNPNIYLGGISTHFYVEFDSRLEAARLEDAVNRVISNQEMMRAYICEDGTQRILEEAPHYKIPFVDIRGYSREKQEAELLAYRKKAENRIFPLGQWPMFEIAVFKTSQDNARLIIDFDMMIVDGMSTEILIQEILQNYESAEKTKAPGASFSEYIAFKVKEREKKDEIDKKFWDERIDDFVSGPFLEKTSQDQSDVPDFRTIETIIPAEVWQKTNEKLHSERIVPAIFLMTVYAKTVSVWTNQEKVTINMTLSDRKGLPGKKYNEVVGDFTKVLPVDYDFSGEDDLLQVSRTTQKKVSLYKKHLSTNIMLFGRKVMQKDHTEDRCAFPFVFTSMMFDLAKNGWKEFGERIYQISQTPQVLLDNQITLKNGALTIHWDFPCQYWREERLKDMQQYFLDLVLYGKDMHLQKKLDDFLDTYNDTAKKIEFVSALDRFEKQAADTPDAPAVLTETAEINYEDLDEMSNREANFLIEKYGMEKGYLIEGERNYRTIVHMLAVLKSGGYYVPCAPNLPENRLMYIKQKSDAVAILNDETYWDENCDDYSDARPERSHDNADKLMYVIYTSGTTGNPKGVAITHRSLINTVDDINERFDVTSDDQIIGISSFGFDLSVYDVFGALTSGASVVLHDKQENIYGMIDELKNYSITIWNTVPALMQLVVNELDPDYENRKLRLVMLSGDWIPLELPERIREKFPNAEVISLGGATEASIWSIYYPVLERDPEWNSIPYGYPLRNQTMYVLNYEGQCCPPGVEGDIYIGGIGVALGYQNDPEKTAAQFVEHPKYGRLYYTGDRGVFSPEGYMVFRGRIDNQVKIHGNRIELGEIESCLKKRDGVSNAIANVVEDKNGAKKLLAYYVPDDTAPYDSEWVKETSAVQTEDMKKAVDNLPDHVTVEEFSDITEALEEVSLAIISNAFWRYGFFVETGEIYSLEELLNRGRIVEKYRKLIYQWANTLVKAGKLKQISYGLYKTEVPLHEIDVDSMYKEIAKKKGVEFWKGSFEFLMLCNRNVQDILDADVDPLTILFPDGTTDRADNIYRFNPVAEYMNNLAACAIEDYIKNWKKERPVRILEFGAGTGGTTGKILEKIKDYPVEYTFTDLSTFFTDIAEKQFGQYPFVQYGLFNIDEKPQAQGYEPASFDIIVGANVLHDAKVIDETLKNFRYLLTGEGMLLALEVTTNKIYHKVSIGFIEGFSGYSDERLIKNEPLLSAPEWAECMEKAGFRLVSAYPMPEDAAEVFEQHVVFGYAAHSREYLDEDDMMEALHEDLPSYMIPDRIYALYEIPLSANSKVNYKELPYQEEKLGNSNAITVPPATETEKILHEIIRETLGLKELSCDVNIFTMGADSLKSISVLTKLKSRGIDVSLSNMYKYSTIQQMAAYIDADKAAKQLQGEWQSEQEIIEYTPDPEARYEPFPLSDLQESYYIGSHETQGFNSIPTAGYVEIECRHYDHERMKKCIYRLMERHDMLRAYIDDKGMQHVLPEVPELDIPVTDMREKPEKAVDDYLMQVRRDMLALRLDLSKAPLFAMQVTRLEEERVLIHVYADGQIMDGWSFQMFFTELGTLYQEPDTYMEPLQVTFRDYIMYREELKKTEKYKQDKAFWMEKIPNLPQAGTLPLIRDISELKEVKGIQVECGLPIDEWHELERKARVHGVSAFSVLFTSFSIAVARWNDKRRFLLNMPEFYRPAFHPDIFKVLGECASFLLYTVDDDPNETFGEKVIRTQQQIMELKDHNSFTGMEITREIYRKNNGFSEVLAPLVFGMLPDAPQFEDNFLDVEKNLLKICYQENHTSQIWIDVNTCVYSDRIEFNYNSLEGLVRKSVLQSLADMQKSILNAAAYDDGFWEETVDLPLPADDEEIIRKSNSTEKEFDLKPLPLILADSFEKNAGRECVRTLERVYTYEEVGRMVRTFAEKLREEGVKPGDYVGVYMEKGASQIVAALAAAYIGAVYTPLEYTYTDTLVRNAMNWINARYLIVSEAKAGAFKREDFSVIRTEHELPADDTVSEPGLVRMKDPAVIIHTSGTTGRPKAVVIRQESLVNAVADSNDVWNISPEDCAIAVTNNAHDMSLYDIFGMIAAGAAIAVPEEKYAKDPSHWLDLMKKYRVTVWNSVPAIQEMLQEAITENSLEAVSDIRLMMLGGDYIKTSLLQKVKKRIPDAEMFSVGGPTETTLWNIMHKVTEKDLSAGTVPYGKPTANNRYYILNENMQQLPVGVTGTLYGAGIGVADGYCENQELTDEKFILFGENRERIYNTGDRGHYREDGAIIFDGREDEQVKINGKRIELNAVSSTAEQVEGVRRAAALKNDMDQLVLFYCASWNIDKKTFSEQIGESLPDYMIPQKILQIEDIPVTLNGKVDKHRLLEKYEAEEHKKAASKPEIRTAQGDELEKQLTKMFCELLGIEDENVDVDADLFAMGGNSLIAMRLLSQMRDVLSVEVTLTDLFATSTIREMKELIERKMMAAS